MVLTSSSGSLWVSWSISVTTTQQDVMAEPDQFKSQLVGALDEGLTARDENDMPLHTTLRVIPDDVQVRQGRVCSHLQNLSMTIILILQTIIDVFT